MRHSIGYFAEAAAKPASTRSTTDGDDEDAEDDALAPVIPAATLAERMEAAVEHVERCEACLLAGKPCSPWTCDATRTCAACAASGDRCIRIECVGVASDSGGGMKPAARKFAKKQKEERGDSADAKIVPFMVGRCALNKRAETVVWTVPHLVLALERSNMMRRFGLKRVDTSVKCRTRLAAALEAMISRAIFKFAPLHHGRPDPHREELLLLLRRLLHGHLWCAPVLLPRLQLLCSSSSSSSSSSLASSSSSSPPPQYPHSTSMSIVQYQ